LYAMRMVSKIKDVIYSVIPGCQYFFICLHAGQLDCRYHRHPKALLCFGRRGTLAAGRVGDVEAVACSVVKTPRSTLVGRSR
jgi:hypothetical protein